MVHPPTLIFKEETFEQHRFQQTRHRRRHRCLFRHRQVYADRLAARGYDLVLVARRADRLHQIAADLQERFSIRAEVLVADLAQPAGLSATVERITGDDAVSLLVNNAGFSAAKPLVRDGP